jgi:hypothetical protein
MHLLWARAGLLLPPSKVAALKEGDQGAGSQGSTCGKRGSCVGCVRAGGVWSSTTVPKGTVPFV